ncbi:hypothetical protein CHH26_09520 [Qipengyuania flava]|uniref:hypothetical protein n=1 Tax=Qipengyuania flava TaxID=192812 RepID=UPI000B8C5A45|nr:hypothetical protein [Qipengyuania flava]ASP30433.1 hypothetical protein CHH26_09520 [Qipengyuania flava]
MSKYAADTSVSVSNSKAEIERIIERYGAAQFMSGWSQDRAVIGFAMEERQVRFVLQMPPRDGREFTKTPTGKDRSDAAAYKAWEQACRQRWRALALVIKAKLEAVESGISIFEDEFMANIVLPSGRTVSEEVRQSIAAAYETGQMQPLLPDYSGETQ